MSYQVNATNEVEKNSYFRQVLFTGVKSQLVVMNIPPGGEIGEETHKHVEQTLIIHSGRGMVVLDGVKSDLVAGDTVVVTPGTKHNFLNTGADDLKIITVYAPPNHIDGRVHKTKAEADADFEDEKFGEANV
ncbi:MAG: cupin domain-containing protein [bacterium]